MKRYKMAIYQEGGHFQFHRDSLHADNHQATLLLEVRSAHEGGKFVIDHYGCGPNKIEVVKDYIGKETYDTMFEMSFDETGSVSTPLKWMAFYTDALHKVERVTSGTRIVIQYDVYIDTEIPVVCGDSIETSCDDNSNKITEEDSNSDNDEGCYDDSSIDDSPKSNPYIDLYSSNFGRYRFPCITKIAMQKVLKELDLQIAKSGTQNIAIPLFHRYSALSIQRKYLKGPDRLLFDIILKEKKYALGLSPVVITAESYDEKFNNESYNVKFTDPMNVCYYWSTRHGDIRSKAILGNHYLNSRRCVYVVSKREEVSHIGTTPYNEWVGNNAEPAKHKYFLCVIVVALK